MTLPRRAAVGCDIRADLALVQSLSGLIDETISRQTQDRRKKNSEEQVMVGSGHDKISIRLGLSSVMLKQSRPFFGLESLKRGLKRKSAI